MANNPCTSCAQSFLYTPPRFPMGTRKSLYSNNAMVFYKTNTVTSCPGGTVRNARAIARRT